MPLALALSPHLDDAVFSAGGTLARLARDGWRVCVATLFTRSMADPTGFALACQTDKGIAPDVDYMALRRREDACAMRALGAEPVWLPFAEAPHRGYGSAQALFAGPLAEDDVVPALAAAVAGLLRRLGPDLVLAPQAIGGHVDHVQLGRALALGRDPVDLTPARLDRPALWWRDFPYVAREAAPAEPFGEEMTALPELAVPLDGRAAAAKRAACLAYESQLGFQFGGSSGLDARLAATGAVERFRVGGALPAAARGSLAAN